LRVYDDVEDVALGHSAFDQFREFIDALNRFLGLELGKPQVTVGFNAKLGVFRDAPNI
jgi:hypothetical protein